MKQFFLIAYNKEYFQTLVVLFAFTLVAYANDGFFVNHPNGYSVFPAYNSFIKMDSETLHFYLPKFLGNPEEKEVSVKAIFNFTNISKDTQIITMGFPFSYPSLDGSESEEEKKDWLLYRKYFTKEMSFVVLEGKDTLNTVVKKNVYGKKLKTLKPIFDSPNEYRPFLTDEPWVVFTWKSKFEPKEKKRLLCTYTMPVSHGFESTGDTYEWFNYITVTGSLWKGKIESAVFKYYLPQRFFLNSEKDNYWAPFRISISDSCYSYSIEDTFSVFTLKKRKWKPVSKEKEGYRLHKRPDVMQFPFCYYKYFQREYEKRLYTLQDLIPPSAYLLDVNRSEYNSFHETDSFYVCQYLNLLKNEIYARAGYDFTDKKYKSFFGCYGWYEPMEGIELSDVEKRNIDFIQHCKEKPRDLIWFVRLMDTWNGVFVADDSFAVNQLKSSSVTSELKHFTKVIFLSVFNNMVGDSSLNMNAIQENWADYMINRERGYVGEAKYKTYIRSIKNSK